MGLFIHLPRLSPYLTLLFLTFLLLLLSVVLCVLPQFAAVGTAVGVRLYEELHLHHRETLRPLQPEVGAPGSFQRGQHEILSAVCSRLCLFTSQLLVSPALLFSLNFVLN